MATPVVVISKGFVPSLSTCKKSPGASMAPTAKGTFDGMAGTPVSNAWEPESVRYGLYAPDWLRNRSHGNDAQIPAMLRGPRRTKDREARKPLIVNLQRPMAEQQYDASLYCAACTGS
jgi:hypothetical protein